MASASHSNSSARVTARVCKKTSSDRSDPPPEAGFARREANSAKQRLHQAVEGRLLNRVEPRLRSQGGGPWGNQGFPHE